MLPESSKFEPALYSWCEAIKYRFGQPRFPKDWLSGAIIKLEFKEYLPEKKTPNLFTLDSASVNCRIEIMDKDGNSYIASRSCLCRPHNPRMEGRRVQAHWNSFLSHLVKD